MSKESFETFKREDNKHIYDYDSGIFYLNCGLKLLKAVENKVPFNGLKSWITKRQELIANQIATRKAIIDTKEAEEFLNKPGTQ